MGRLRTLRYHSGFKLRSVYPLPDSDCIRQCEEHMRADPPPFLSEERVLSGRFRFPVGGCQG